LPINKTEALSWARIIRIDMIKRYESMCFI
jgi:hypothetical protein